MKLVKAMLGISGMLALILAFVLPAEAGTPMAPAQQGGGSCTIGTWTPVASLNAIRSRTAVAYSAVNDRFYVLGGESTGGNRAIPIEMYDPGTNTWVNQASLLTGVSNSGAVGVGNYIYVPSGYDGVGGILTMQRYDPVANTVAAMSNLPAGNFTHAVTAMNGMVYVLGGSATGVAGTTNYIYNIATDTWSSGAPLPIPVQYPAAASDGTYVYVMGGNTTNLNTVQRYDPATNSWSTPPAMGTGRGGPAAFFDGFNVWAVNGGWASYLTSTEYWDGAAWVPGPSTNVGVRTVGAAFGNGTAMKAGGWNGGYSGAAETLSIDCAPPAQPGIVMTKTVGTDAGTCATTSSISAPYGSTVYYCYTVENTGNVTLTHHTVVDDVMGTVLGPDASYNLAPGDTFSFIEPYTLTSESVTNVAVWTASISGTAIVATATGTATVTGSPTDVTLTGFTGGSGAIVYTLPLLALVLLAAAGLFVTLRRQNS